MRPSHRRLELVLLVAAVLLWGCGSSRPGPSSTQVLRPASSTASAAVSTATPLALPPASAIPPEPIDLLLNAVVVTVSDRVRVRSEARVSDDSIKYEPVLPVGTKLTILDGPVSASGYTWYKVAPVSFKGLEGPGYGWVAMADKDGEPWIALADSSVAAAAAEFMPVPGPFQPRDIATDGTYLYVADVASRRIVKLGATDLSFVAEVGGPTWDVDPYGVAVGGGFVYVTDLRNHRIIRLSDTLDGSGWGEFGGQGSGDGEFKEPHGIALWRSMLFVADQGNNRIVRLSAELDGSGWVAFGSFGSETGRFRHPTGVAVSAGLVYVAATENRRIIRLDASLDGSGWRTFGRLGQDAGQFLYPSGIAVSAGYVYVADPGAVRIARLSTALDGSGWRTYGGALIAGWEPSFGIAAAADWVALSTQGSHGTLGPGRVIRMSARLDGTGWNETTPPPPLGEVAFRQLGLGSGPDDRSTGLSIGDLDRDGRTDLVTLNLDTPMVVRLGDGASGDFRFVRQEDLATAGASAVVVANLDADRRPDVVTGHVGSVVVFPGDGTGRLGPGTRYSGTGGAASIAVGDVNGDGRDDVVVAFEGSGAVMCLLGTGAARLAVRGPFAAGGDPVAVAIGDLTGDSRPDLAIADRASDAIAILRGDGAGGFERFGSVAVGDGPAALALGDIDHDGRLDLAVANRAGRTISVRRGDGAAQFGPQATIAVGTEPVAVALQDVNADLEADLVVALDNGDSGTILVLPGNGRGEFSVGGSYRTIFPLVSLATGDFNGDAQPDVAALSRIGTIAILINTTARPWPDLRQIPVVLSGVAAEPVAPATTLRLGQRLRLRATLAAFSTNGGALTGTLSFRLAGRIVARSVRVFSTFPVNARTYLDISLPLTLSVLPGGAGRYQLTAIFRSTSGRYADARVNRTITIRH